MINRWVFFFVHFVLGFSVLWLTYYYSQGVVWGWGLSPVFSLERSAIEISFLVAAVFWGNLGWGSWVRLSAVSTSSDFVSELADSTAPLAIFTPVVIGALEFWSELDSWGIYWAADSINSFWLLSSVVVWVALYLYRVEQKRHGQAWWIKNSCRSMSVEMLKARVPEQ
jgi:formate hydrogenlyase subunit 3/multisubunit Na+/H+ antiporter MnhD subunit